MNIEQDGDLRAKHFAIIPYSDIITKMAIQSYRDEGTRDIAESMNSKAARRTLPVHLHQPVTQTTGGVGCYDIAR